MGTRIVSIKYQQELTAYIFNTGKKRPELFYYLVLWRFLTTVGVVGVNESIFIKSKEKIGLIKKSFLIKIHVKLIYITSEKY